MKMERKKGKCRKKILQNMEEEKGGMKMEREKKGKCKKNTP